jgi:hypothetical protein
MRAVQYGKRPEAGEPAKWRGSLKESLSQRRYGKKVSLDTDVEL